ncbi:hypothetical protein NL676_026867 [Syzygium grande]|nr:hypothetical protein NL676_026867 [Syzygium grande]
MLTRLPYNVLLDDAVAERGVPVMFMPFTTTAAQSLVAPTPDNDDDGRVRERPWQLLSMSMRMGNNGEMG